MDQTLSGKSLEHRVTCKIENPIKTIDEVCLNVLYSSFNMCFSRPFQTFTETEPIKNLKIKYDGNVSMRLFLRSPHEKAPTPSLLFAQMR